MPTATSVRRSARKNSSSVPALNTPMTSNPPATPGRRTSSRVGRRAKTAPTSAVPITILTTISALSGMVEMRTKAPREPQMRKLTEMSA